MRRGSQRLGGRRGMRPAWLGLTAGWRRNHALAPACAVLLLAGCGLVGSMAAAQAQAPLAVIDWLRDLQPPHEGLSNDLPQNGAVLDDALPMTPVPEQGQDAGGAAQSGQDNAISAGAGSELGITMRPLDQPRLESVGLFPARRIGLPGDIWGPSNSRDLAALMAILPVDTLPALRDLSYRLLLAEFASPGLSGADPQAEAEAFLQARLQALTGFGAMDQAGALLEAIDPLPLSLLAHRFDIRLLLDEDEAACRELDAAGPALAARPATAQLPGSLQAALIFCEARAGSWEGAAARLAALQDSPEPPLPRSYLQLLDAFIHYDEHADEGAALPGLPERPSPLAWRLLEALGEPVGTLSLPLAFAHADLRGTAGWRAQIEAAERLVRSGALPPNRLLGLYTERRAAASGGIWERVRRVQALDAALAGGDSAVIGAALMAAWPQFQDAELETAFAYLFAAPLMAAELTGPAWRLALTVGLLSDDYELAGMAMGGGGGDNSVVAGATPPVTLSLRERQLAAIARGLPPPEAGRATAAPDAAVLSAFASPTVPASALPADALARLAEGRIGEELLRVLVRMGASGDPRMLAEGLAVLRYLGLEDIARRTALHAMLLERRG